LPSICQLSGRADADAITEFRAVLPGYCRSRVESHTVSLSLHDRPRPARLRLLFGPDDYTFETGRLQIKAQQQQ
jgi:hypothetical protein